MPLGSLAFYTSLALMPAVIGFAVLAGTVVSPPSSAVPNASGIGVTVILALAALGGFLTWVTWAKTPYQAILNLSTGSVTRVTAVGARSSPPKPDFYLKDFKRVFFGGAAGSYAVAISGRVGQPRETVARDISRADAEELCALLADQFGLENVGLVRFEDLGVPGYQGRP
jgi:hypothetical protein